MNNTLAFINSLMKPKDQWPMSYAGSEPGMSLPEYHESKLDMQGGVTSEIPTVQLAAEDKANPNEIADLIAALLANQPSYRPGQADDISGALDKLLGSYEDTKAQAQIDMYEGATMKTVAAASDAFSSLVGIFYGGNIDRQRDLAQQNYQNQMDALDNQVIYIKHQLSDRFNKIVDTNIAQMAARNMRVTAGNVLEQTKDVATEITEDMRTAESNAELKKIALRAGQKQAKWWAKNAHAQQWFGFAKSILKLGMQYETGGGTGESFGDLFAGYQMGNAIKNQSFNELY